MSTSPGTGHPELLASWLTRTAAHVPAGIAVEGPDCTLDYRELHVRVTDLAARIRAAGLQADRVAIAASRSTETIVAILAAVAAGTSYVPLDPTYPNDRLRVMLDQAAPHAVLGSRDDVVALERRLGPLPSLARPAPSAGAPTSAAGAAATYVLFTSGSTGRPKGVAMGERPLAHLVDWHVRHPRLGRPARTLQFAPLSFDVHFQEILTTIATGGTLVLVPEQVRRDPATLLAALVQARVQRLFLPYIALQLLAEAASGSPLPPLLDVVSAGEQLQLTPVIRALFERLPGVALHNHYGPTETHVVTAHELDGPPSTWPDVPPIGRALPHVAIALEPEGEVGELLLGGEALAHGYLGDAELTATRFVTDPPGRPGRWYRTGDQVKRNVDGVLQYLGRLDDQIKVDGFRVEPAEIELALMAAPGVREAVVTAPTIAGLGRTLTAHVVLAPGAAEAATQLAARLRQHLHRSLPGYMVPLHYMVLDALPTTPSGKIDRAALPAPGSTAAGSVSSTAVAAPDDPVATVRAIWRALLGAPSLGDDDNLFDQGARSLLVLQFVARARVAGIADISVADVYDRPTIATLLARSAGSRRAARRSARGTEGAMAIAIVGMACRVPDAGNIDELWANLLAGRESIRHFTPEELDPAVPQAQRGLPNFVPARGVLADADRFDATFFGVSPREATLLDPQQRLLLELAWTALEHAAIDPARQDATVGVYVGTANNSYVQALREAQPALVAQSGEFATMLASEKDYAATRIAHRLNLRGPAVSVYTACSTSLVAITQACHSLASGQCDVALAGGATVIVPQYGGYLHVEGGMESADGHCRPFDAGASGTVFSSGGGMVVLKRLDDALAEGDRIHAVIRGVGLNNDGGAKASFTAPSVSGQAGAIRMALDQAGVNARDIAYVEAHGTGTALGDPIEIAALAEAWRSDTSDVQFCGIGSIKGNLGHLIAAAGVLGLIKAVLSIDRDCVPATINHVAPNPHVDFGATPFRVIDRATPWPRGAQPRIAAVSSFGVGGTNAHVVLAEPPLRAAGASGGDEWRIFPLSARSDSAVRARASALATVLRGAAELPLAPIAATLARGRVHMPRRLAIVADSARSLAAALDSAGAPRAAIARPRLVFLFPGQGSQYPGMARQLHAHVPAFRMALEQCLDSAGPLLGEQFARCLLEAAADDPEAAAYLADTRVAQPALFATAYATAAWLASLGIRPDAMIGHSIGEYVAACMAGVLALEDAMLAVVARGQAMSKQPAGRMLAVRAAAGRVREYLADGVEIAAFNGPEAIVLAGVADAVAATEQALALAGVACTSLNVSHAFHSASMDGALPAVRAALSSSTLNVPRLPLYSCVSGELLTPEDAVSADYWARQVRAPVQFSRAVHDAALADTVFVEVGPGQALSTLVRQLGDVLDGTHAVSMSGPSRSPGDAYRHGLRAIADLWTLGVDVAWPVPANAERATLPTYPFEGDRYWFAPRAAVPADTAPALSPGVAHLGTAAPHTAGGEQSRAGRRRRIAAELLQLVADASGLGDDEITTDATFVQLGLDSLSLTQLTLELERRFGTRIRFRRLLEDLHCLDALTLHLDETLPSDAFIDVLPASVVPPTAPESYPPTGADDGVGATLRQMQTQLQSLAAQLAQLTGSHRSIAPASADVSRDPATFAPSGEAAPAATPSLVAQPFGASARITIARRGSLDSRQQAWLDAFTQRYTERTAGSRRFSEAHRDLMADPRVVTGFDPRWKELVYPIVVERSAGARLWDIDGNEYIDLLSSFGANLIGYSDPDVTAAMQRQLEAGIEVGPQHPLAATVAGQIARLTGMERVAFCSTGSEAVMGALRIARTVTGRRTVAVFTDAYHGIFDEVIVRSARNGTSRPAAPGILASAVEHVLVLEYGSDAALATLRERGQELAAIMIEPIQNKHPDLWPAAFVRKLRTIADAAGCALIFDEVVTGFRIALGGAQEVLGVRADIATFGKVIGGGLPFAAIAGSARWLDALDGGPWRFGDDSHPEAGVTYFAGTFVRHPLALAAAHAMLLRLERDGAELLRTLNERTTQLAQRLNDAFAQRDAPVRVVHFASLWRLQWQDGQPNVALFYYLARHHGLHVYEQFGHFVTAAFTDADIDAIVQRYVATLDELLQVGLITAQPTSRDAEPAAMQQVPIPAQAGEPRVAALAPGQVERWLVAGLDSAAIPALNESFCIRLEGGVNVDALAAAVRDVVERHEAFRIGFDADSPAQQLHEHVAVPIIVHDLRERSDAEGEIDRIRRDAIARPFPLASAPLAAIQILRPTDSCVLVNVVASHLVLDGWGASVFLSELAQCYPARSRGLAAVLPAAESPLDFAVTECARSGSADARKALAYWCSTLQEAPAPLVLGDLQPPGPLQFSADTHAICFDPVRTHALRTAARAANATLFQWLLCAVSVCLHRLAGSGDFVLCVPFASQSLAHHGPLIADGVLELPVRIRCVADEPVMTLLTRIRNTLVDALEHPLVTQRMVARELGIVARQDAAPFSNIYFNLNPAIDVSGFAPLRATMTEARKQALLPDLFFNFNELGDRVSLDLQYGSERVSAARAVAIVSALEQVLEDMAQSPGTRVGANGRASSQPVDARIVQWNTAHVALAPACRLEHWITGQAEATPDATAVVAGDSEMSYATLEQSANRMAHALLARGVTHGSRVGVCLSRGPALLPALLAVLKCGATYVPLDPGFPARRLQFMAADADVALVVTEAAHRALAGVEAARIFCIDSDDALADSPATPPPVIDATPQDIAYIIYTSGSTGQPKGVVVRHRSVCNLLAAMRRRPGLAARERLLAVTTLSFDIAVLELFLPLVCGATVVLSTQEQSRDPDALAQLIVSARIDIVQATPTTWHMLVDAGWQPKPGFRALCGGEALPPPLATQLIARGVELWNMYGPTETTVWSTVSRVSSTLDGIDIGTPIDNTQVWILDAALQPCAVGEEGEIWIGGAGVADGYRGLPALTQERFIADPFTPGTDARLYRTGDLGRWSERGVLLHHGRADLQVKIRGFRIELGEIEAVLAEQPGISRAVVVDRPDVHGDPGLAGFIVAAGGRSLDMRGVRRALRERLPDYMVPTLLQQLDALPLLPNDKVDRKALQAHGAQPPAGKPGSLPADTSVRVPAPPAAAHLRNPIHQAESPAVHADLEQRISQLMAENLGIPSVARDENFFELGGHSLLAARLSAALARELGQRPTLRTIFEAPTPATLAAALRPLLEQPVDPRRSIHHRADQATAPLSLMQQRVWFLENLTPGTVVHSIPTGHRLVGDLDVGAFDAAFADLVQRHSVLRTVIERTEDGAQQRILPSLTASQLPVDDLSALPESERGTALAARIRALVEVPYDLERGPLFTARLFRLSRTEHVWLFQAHHLIWDAWSFDILYGDLAELYAARLDAREARLPPILVTYGDYAAWQLGWVTGAELARQTEYWCGELTPLPDALELPAARPRPREMSGRGGFHQFNLPRELTLRLRAQAQARGRTLYVTLFAAYALMLGRLAGRPDFVVGTPVRGREQVELEPLMGFFVNMLPMRVTIDPDTRLDAWLDALHAKVVASFASADVPFDSLVRALTVPRDVSRPPVHQVSFSYQDVRERPTRWGNVEHSRSPTPMLGAAQDLSLWCVETRNHIEFVYTYNADVFDEAQVRAFAALGRAILEEIDRDAQASLAHYGNAAPAVAALPAAAAARVPAQAVADAPQTEVERAIADVWSRLLDTADIRRGDNFFDIGGHSLLAMRAIAEIEKRIGVRIAVRRLIYDTLAEIAATPGDTAPESQPGEDAATHSAKELATAPRKRPGLLARLIAAFRDTDANPGR